jgi:hypothetical protein
MAGDLIRAADNRHLIDKAFHQDIAKRLNGHAEDDTPGTFDA